MSSGLSLLRDVYVCVVFSVIQRGHRGNIAFTFCVSYFVILIGPYSEKNSQRICVCIYCFQLFTKVSFTCLDVCQSPSVGVNPV